MTTTVPPITLDTHCPSWCVRHAWYVGGEGQESHHHGAEVELSYPPFQNESGKRQFTVEPLREVSANGTVENHVFINDCANGVLASETEVGELIAALFKAGRRAFADDAAAIRRVLAERAVLEAVRAWVDGDGKTLAIENAYSLLAALADER